MNMEISIGSYTIDDLKEARKLFNARTKKRRMLIPLFYLLPLLVLIGGIIGKQQLPESLVFTLTFLILLVYIILLQPLMVPYQAFIKLNKALKKNNLKPLSLELSDKGIKTQNESISTDMSWDYFTKYFYNEKILLLFRKNNLLLIIPTRCVKNWEELTNLVKEKIALS